MIGHLLLLLLRFASHLVSYNHERDRAGKMGVGGFRCGLGGKEIVLLCFSGNDAVLNSNSMVSFSSGLQWHSNPKNRFMRNNES